MYYNNCQSLPLQVFLEITNTGDYGLLKHRGIRWRNDKLALELWGDILIEYAELEGNMQLKNKFDKVVALRQLQNSYTTIKAMIRLLHYITPSHEVHGTLAQGTIDDLAKMGYVVDVSSSKAYAESLLKLDKKSNSLVTLIRMKQNELEGNHDEHAVSFDEIFAMLQIHFHDIKENITVKRYIACKKVVKQRQQSSQGSKAKP